MNSKTRSKFGSFKPLKGMITGQLLGGVENQRSLKSSLAHQTTAKNSYGCIANLEVRLASSKKDIKNAQRLRYKVFYEELNAIPDTKTKLKRRDIDFYDKFCDHLLLTDHGQSLPYIDFPNISQIMKPKIVGTYRLLSEKNARTHGGFYSEREYNLAPLLNAKAKTHKFLELGRSCVAKPYRSKRALELLWHGIWTYIRENNIDVLIGCASFQGIDPTPHAASLSFLHHHKLAEKEWRVSAHDHLNINMNLIAPEKINLRQVMKTMPPLIKGYLRLGACFGEGAVIDHQFGTIDVMVILPVTAIDQRYLAHFGEPNEKSSRLKS